MVLLASWETAYRVIGWKDYVFPAPSHIVDALTNLLGVPTAFGQPVTTPGWPWIPGTHFSISAIVHSELVSAPLVSGQRLIEGFSVSLLLGLMLGLAMWRWPALDGFLGSLFLGMQTLPSVCWVPLAVLCFGLEERGILFVLVMGSFFAVALSLRDGLRTIPPHYLHAGRMLGARSWRLAFYVLIPAAMPAMAGSLRQGFSFAWRSLMGAELIFAARRHGLGYLLAMGQNTGYVAQVVAIMICMIMVGMLADRLVFAPLEKTVARRFGLGG
jgi:NitT/TauT family transport system permease protein